ncbi:hypothetical protein CLIM01_06028 [Colletotrichum limetticola]|uniref:Lpxtg-domain-containing protein n=1 Tax=Colletotrichum limetticola TaxID=1209924 RepID=A0ABQ9PYI2_9PEZI|nr:hypothetical protein CLIM01_06028 [Colletotrichum limetticola]
MRSSTGVLVLGLWLSRVSAIHVANGSPCQTLCGNVLDATTKNDVVCDEHSYSSSAGSVYQQCVSCELSSDYATSTNETDTQWALYNLRYAISYCTFGYPDNPNVGSSPCLTRTACEPLQKAITYSDLASNVTEFEYCDVWDHNQVASCSSCLRAGNNNFINNFLTILDAGCQQKPVPGTTISVDGSPFSKTRVNITEPTPTNTYVSDYNSGPISLGGKVGIAIGGVVLLLVVAGFCIVWNGKRRRRAFLKTLEMKQQGGGGRTGWPTPLNTSGIGGTPLSQKPLRTWDASPQSRGPSRGWDDSPMSANGEQPYTRYFSPYSSQYNSPVSGAEAPAMQWPVNDANPQRQPQEIGLAFGGDNQEQRWNDSKGKERSESYEMRDVEPEWDARQRYPSPPNVQQPAHTVYAEHNPAAYHGLTEEDLRRGYAL